MSTTCDYTTIPKPDHETASHRAPVGFRPRRKHKTRAATAELGVARKKSQPLDRQRQWALELSERIGHNKAAVALANKLARRLWASEHHRKSFDPNHDSVRGAPTPNN